MKLPKKITIAQILNPFVWAYAFVCFMSNSTNEARIASGIFVTLLANMTNNLINNVHAGLYPRGVVNGFLESMERHSAKSKKPTDVPGSAPVLGNQG